MKFLRLFLLLILAAGGAACADPEPATRFEATVQTQYEGTHQDLYDQEHDRVRLLVRQAQLEISSQLGLLQYQEGFRRPITIRFDDNAATGIEFALAYVRMVSTAQGPEQQLVVNLDVMSHYGKDFDQIFYHEMTHAVLNDAVVFGNGRPLPSWVQEGLAVFISGEGEARVHALAQRVRKSHAKELVRGLEVPVLDYARNYLAFKYLKEKYSINAVQAFVRELIAGKTPEEAIEESSGVSWEIFTQGLKEYSLEAYQEQARPDF